MHSFRKRGPSRGRWPTAAAAAPALALLAGCAAYGPQGLPPGTSSAAVIERMGPPRARFANPDGGERLEFWRGPYAHHDYMLDFDAEGRLLRWQQVRSEHEFFALRPGMSKEEVLYRIGHPSDVQFIHLKQHQVWSYRYVSPFCTWFQVSLDTADRVAELGTNNDPLCTVPSGPGTGGAR